MYMCECGTIDEKLNEDILKLLDKIKRLEESLALLNSNSFHRKTTEHWMKEYSKLHERHLIVVSNKKKQFDKMKEACRFEISKNEEYTSDLQHKYLYYRALSEHKNGTILDEKENSND